jgi:hypothetical protein
MKKLISCYKILFMLGMRAAQNETNDMLFELHLFIFSYANGKAFSRGYPDLVD